MKAGSYIRLRVLPRALAVAIVRGSMAPENAKRRGSYDELLRRE